MRTCGGVWPGTRSNESTRENPYVFYFGGAFAMPPFWCYANLPRRRAHRRPQCWATARRRRPPPLLVVEAQPWKQQPAWLACPSLQRWWTLLARRASNLRHYHRWASQTCWARWRLATTRRPPGPRPWRQLRQAHGLAPWQQPTPRLLPGSFVLLHHHCPRPPKTERQNSLVDATKQETRPCHCPTAARRKGCTGGQRAGG